MNCRHSKSVFFLAVIMFFIVGLPLGWHRGMAESDNALNTLPRELEIELALSALPQHLRSGATVYVLNVKKGFEVAKTGTNGFHTFVARNDIDGLKTIENPGSYRDVFLIPMAFDAEGAQKIMPVWFDAAQEQIKNTPQGDVRKLILERLASGYYKAPSKSGISYMLAPLMRVYPEPGKNAVMTMSMPHYMFYAPGVTNEEIGGSRDLSSPFIANQGPHGYIIKTAGEREAQKIVADNKLLLEKLCKFRKEFCLSEGHGSHP